jgi:hypothetical protein
VNVRIGVTYIPREIEVELADDVDPAAIRTAIEEAVGQGSGLLWLTDRRGHQVGVAVDKLAYIDLGSGSDSGRIGFGSG